MNVRKRLRRLLNTRLRSRSTTRQYQIGAISIEIPDNHPLPGYQRDHPLYDRFLRHVGEHDDRGWYIDIGANVGDSAAALAQSSGKSILCVEPPGPFIDLLGRNAATISASGNTVVVCSEAVGPAGSRIELIANKGTARSQEGGGPLSCVPLDSIAEQYCRNDRIRLIKCDIDGLDGKALMTGSRTIAASQAALYFEYSPTSTAEGAFYASLLSFLETNNYNVALFDNFGLPIAKDQSPSFALPFSEYMLAMNAGLSTRTFYYLDVFAYLPSDETAKRWLNSYFAIT